MQSSSSSFLIPFPTSPSLRHLRRIEPWGGGVVLPVGDLDRAVDFYCGLIGLALRLRVGDGRADVETMGLRLSLLAASEVVTPCQLRLMVVNVPAAVALARGHGAAVEVDGDDRAWLRDPDGHRLWLCPADWGVGPSEMPAAAERKRTHPPAK